MAADDRYAALRTGIVAQAEAHIARAGLATLRARDLARAAGCALGTLYNVFKDIDEIVLAVNARTLSRLGTRLTADAAAHRAPEALIVGLGAVYVTFAVEDANLWEALFSHQMSSGRAVPADYVARYDALFMVLEEPVAALIGSSRAADARDLARTLFSAVHGITALGLGRKIDATDRAETETRLRTFLTIFIAGLTASTRRA